MVNVEMAVHFNVLCMTVSMAKSGSDLKKVSAVWLTLPTKGI